MENTLLSVLIKSYNEEDKIANCIESILRQVDMSSTEVILVDSNSTDRTVSIAKDYPIKIYKLPPNLRPSAPLGAELGYQLSCGKFLLFIDGDMELATGFVEAAILALESNQKNAGVGGLLKDTQTFTEADKKRSRLYSQTQVTTSVKCLGGGGLYKREAIEDVGYFAHSGLTACEELELGVRLSSRGYNLSRLNMVSFIHTGHCETNSEMCKRLWVNGRLSSYTLLFKSAIGKPWFWDVVRNSWFLFVGALSIIASLILSYLPWLELSFVSTFCIFWSVAYIGMSLRQRSAISAFWSISLWWLLFTASFKVLFTKIEKPIKKIDSVRVK